MKSITIVLPYPEVEKNWGAWAFSEKKINFKNEVDLGNRCSLAFAAFELKSYLSKTILDCEILVASSASQTGEVISLGIVDQESGGGFSLKPLERGIRIEGDGRNGIFNGIYEFLRMQGWDWIEPGPDGEVQPALTDRLVFPKEEIRQKPTFQYRDFYLCFHSQESEELIFWMMRNRMNSVAWRPSVASLCQKFGMITKMGGHPFEAIMQMDRYLPSGKTIWEAHPEWYGQPETGEVVKEKAQNIQFCSTNPKLADFLANELMEKINLEWSGADIIDVWGFDTWGKTCACATCRPIGSDTDKNLYFLAELNKRLEQGCKEGKIAFQPQLAICGYEGTCTIAAPEKDWSKEIRRHKSISQFAPILRSYAHDLDDPKCLKNKLYCDSVSDWSKIKEDLSIWVLEYYNVSKYEDLPLLMTNRIIHDMKVYARLGVQGMGYMHVPATNWAMRSLTQRIHAQFSWQIDTPVEAFLADYFAKRYGAHAKKMAEIYEKIESASLHISQWRNWAGDSILTQLMAWDGAVPKVALKITDLPTHESMIQSGRRSVGLLRDAYEQVRALVFEEKQANSLTIPAPDQLAVNPVEAARKRRYDLHEHRIAEDLRSLKYGLETMTLMTELVVYYDALEKKNSQAQEASWGKIEAVQESLESYYFPIAYTYPAPGIKCFDAMTRTQLKPTVARCRGFRARVH